MDVLLYDSMTRRKQIFTPIGDRVGMYACGPTVYHYAHIGNMRTYIFEDVLKRVLRYAGFDIFHVMNITDVGHLSSDGDEGEDKMEKGARREGRSVWEIAQHYADAFKKDMARLNLTEPDVWCKATSHIPEQIEQIRMLEEKGFTYRTQDGIYFDTSRLDDYGKLIPNFDPDKMRAGKRVDMGEKRNATDFALWKFSPPDGKRAMEWESPWGVGFPGWHIECSAMSMKYLGDRFDIHCGGIDHIPVHHTNEIAQAEASSGVSPWVGFWMHGEFLLMTDEKMAKSGDSFITVQTLTESGFDPLAYKYFTYSAHYRQQLSFSLDALSSAQSALDTLRTHARRMQDDQGAVLDAYEARFRAEIFDDLNMPRALAVVWDLVRSTEDRGDMAATLRRFDEVLGLDLFTSEQVPQDIMELARKRDAFRKTKAYADADRMRDEITARGFIVEDSPEGTIVRAAFGYRDT